MQEIAIDFGDTYGAVHLIKKGVTGMFMRTFLCCYNKTYKAKRTLCRTADLAMYALLDILPYAVDNSKIF